MVSGGGEVTIRELAALGAEYGEDLTLREVLRRADESAWQAEMATRDRRTDALAAERARVRQDLEDRLADARAELRRRGGR
jgi:hypothetical protein